jgi:hypothetical protein
MEDSSSGGSIPGGHHPQKTLCPNNLHFLHFLHGASKNNRLKSEELFAAISAILTTYTHRVTAKGKSSSRDSYSQAEIDLRFLSVERRRKYFYFNNTISSCSPVIQGRTYSSASRVVLGSKEACICYWRSPLSAVNGFDEPKGQND